MLERAQAPDHGSAANAVSWEPGRGETSATAVDAPKCPACECRETKLYLVGERDPHRPIERPFRFFFCPGCRLRFQVVDRQEAAGLFAEVQQESHRRFAPPRQELRCDEDILCTFADMGSGRRLLDIGSGDGRFLSVARKMGFDCLGVDVSEGLARIAREKSGAPVLVGQLTELDLAEGSFDWINLDQVLSYVPNLREMMQRVADLLRAGGICRIREYDADSLSSRLKGKKYWMYAPTHVNVSTGNSIAALAQAAHLKVMRIVPGTESSLTSWLATERTRTLGKRLRDTVLFGLRRVRLFGVSIAADTVFYLRKPHERGT
jgi:SAM-dependent methyltransferase